MKVVLHLNDGVHFTASTDNDQRFEIDGSETVGGQEKGPRPMELVLGALAGCSAIDVMSTLRKMKQDVSDCQIEVTGERADQVPAVFCHIQLDFLIYGNNLDQRKVQRAVTLAVEKYCSVGKMLESTARISHSTTIHPVPSHREQ
ncbi:MAG: OsmC family protein [Gammaproteobacteria bacterium]|nr:OsmC family protein [Gammaproteobacteria bacterium]MCY4219937.1 OsmC family protein [Gammaproteobacteria bacterium]MCY4275673.1 OsmC family protein [Gammaproteobacteria bacterium]